MKLGNSVVVTCSFKFQVIVNDDEKPQVRPDMLVSFNNGIATTVLKPNYPDLGYKKNLEIMVCDSDFCHHLALSLHKEMAAALLSIEEAD